MRSLVLVFVCFLLKNSFSEDIYSHVLIGLRESSHPDILAALVERAHPELKLKKQVFSNYYLYERRNENAYSKRGFVLEDSLQLDNNIRSIHNQVSLSISKRSSGYDLDYSNLEKKFYEFILKKGKSQDKKATQNICKRSENYPNFNDEKFPLMWNIHNEGQAGRICGNDLNVLPAWAAGYTGKGIVVSVLDDGLQHSHPDLKANYYSYASWDLNDDDDDPTPDTSKAGNNHGTECAGVIAAMANNTICSVGIAYETYIAGVRVLDGPVTSSSMIEALLYKHDIVDIYSASWGPTDDGKSMEGPSKPVEEALKKGATEGRKGKGSLYIWAAGNGGANNDSCSADGYVGNIHSIAIGSITDGGTRSYFSEFCPSLLAVVYTGSHDVNNHYNNDVQVTTDDIDGGCTTKFQGTSSAAPLAAGILALVLQANPNLTSRDIQHLIVSTSNIPSDEQPGWFKNGAGYIFNTQLGAGVMDAAALIATSQNWDTVPPHIEGSVSDVSNYKVKSSVSSEKTSCISIDVYFDGYSNTKQVDRIVQMEAVELYIQIDGEKRGNIAIDLYSPCNTQSRMLEYRQNDEKSNIDFKFASVFNWGENPEGIWSIKVCNRDFENEAIVKQLSLLIHGTAKPFSESSNGVSEILNYQDVRAIMTKRSTANKQMMIKKYNPLTQP